LDECWEANAERRDQALRPATIAVPDSQVWLCSTAGTADSTFWRRYVDLGRLAVSQETTTGLCYAEWSAEEGAPLDAATLTGCMPALGALVDVRAVLSDVAVMDEGEARRAYGNLWTARAEPLYPRATLDAVMVDEVTVSVDSPVYGFDVAVNRRSGSIAMADSDGNVRILEAGLPPAALTARMIEITQENPGTVALDVRGPAATEIRALEHAGCSIRRFSQSPSAREELALTVACGLFSDRLERAELHIERHAALDDALDAAQRHMVGDAWIWSRRDSSADASPLIAATMACYLAARTVTPWAFTRG
jgi:hypothetical protein